MRMSFEPILPKTVSDALVIFILEFVTKVLDRSFTHRQPIDEVLVINTHSEKARTI